MSRDGGERDGRRAAPAEQPPQRARLPTVPADIRQIGFRRRVLFAMVSLCDGRITSLKTLAESGNAGFHCVARTGKQPRRGRYERRFWRVRRNGGNA